MTLKFFCPRWGSEHLEWDIFLEKVKEAGYDGIEYGIPNDFSETHLKRVWRKAESFGLEIIPQHYNTTTRHFDQHRNAYVSWIERIIRFESLKINCQTGRDIFSEDQNTLLIELANELSGRSGISICHETHRGKFSFAAHSTLSYLNRISELRLTLDISHWVNVAESFLQDQEEAVLFAISRTDHIHARIGYPEGPQVPDPQAPEWKEALDTHLTWWNKVLQYKKNEGAQVLTITPEFGPHPYMIHLPFTSQPITNQWQINLYMMNLLKEKFERDNSFVDEEREELNSSKLSQHVV